MAIIDLAGQRFTRLVVVRLAGRIDNGAAWECKCDCGNTLIVRSNGLRTGNTKSCGCYHRDATASRNFKHGASKRKGWTPEFRTWTLIRQRCNNPTDGAYRYYGARGIKVCERWSEFANFLADMGPRPSPKHSIDRINNDGPYSPENCRWATRIEQANNTRNNRLITAHGATKTLAQWAAETNLDGRLIQSRIDIGGWTPERAMGAPPRPHKPYRKKSLR